MGLLSGVLPAVYSASDALKRKVGGLLSDPVGTLQQHVGLLNDNARSFNQLHSKATQESVNSIKGGGSGFGPASQQLAGKLADAYNPMGMVVWHGSPHKFSKFDSSKIGTGEGAQAYGHGLYLAESGKVAQSYAPPVLESDVAENLIRMKEMLPSSTGVMRKNLERAIAESEAGAGGHLYKVDLPDDAIAKMLDWDKPLSQQAPEVQSVLSKVARMDATGEQAWKAAVRESGNPFSPIVEQRGALFDTPEAAAKNLQRLGIPGIRYLDGGSRGAGGGTSNFVVFPGNEWLLNILERNGQPIK